MLWFLNFQFLLDETLTIPWTVIRAFIPNICLFIHSISHRLSKTRQCSLYLFFTFTMPNILILIYEQHLVLCIWTVLFSCCCGYRTCEFFHSVLCFPYIIAFLLPPNLPSCLFFFLPSFHFLAFFLFSWCITQFVWFFFRSSVLTFIQEGRSVWPSVLTYPIIS